MTDPLSYSLSLKTETVVLPLEPSLTSDTSEEEDKQVVRMLAFAPRLISEIRR